MHFADVDNQPGFFVERANTPRALPLAFIDVLLLVMFCQNLLGRVVAIAVLTRDRRRRTRVVSRGGLVDVALSCQDKHPLARLQGTLKKKIEGDAFV